MNLLTFNILSVFKKALRPVLVLLALLAMAIPSEAAPGKNTDGLYRYLLNGDLRKLKQRGNEMIGVNPDSSVMYFSAVAARYDDDLSDSDKDLCIGSLNNLGYVYYYAYNNPLKSYEYLLKALKLSEETGIEKSLPHIYLNIANVFTSMGEFSINESSESEYYLKKSIHKAAALGADDILIISFLNLLNRIYLSEDFALKQIAPEIKLFRSGNIDRKTELYDYAVLYLAGVEASAKGDFAEALKSFEKAFGAINTKLTPERYNFSLRSAIAKTQFQRKDYAAAIANLHKILGYSDAPDIRVSVYSQLSEAFQKRGDADSSAHYRKLYLELADSLLHKGQLQTFHGLENQYITDKLNATIEKSAADRRYYLRIVGIVSGALLLILALGTWAWVSRRRLAKANRLLYEKNRDEMLATESPAKVAPAEEASKSQAPETSEAPATAEADSAADAESRELAARIAEVFASSRDVFSQEFALERLAYLTGATVRKVSKCLNDTMGTNFINEVQKCRIREACRLFEDTEANGRLTIEAISDMVGFKSRSNFVQVFKKITGLTPSQYQKMSRGR